MLATNSVKPCKEFRQQQEQWKVKKAVDQAREHWIKRVALEGETAVKDGMGCLDGSALGGCNKCLLDVNQSGHAQ